MRAGFFVDPAVGFSLLQAGKMQRWRATLVQRLARAHSGGGSAGGEPPLLDLYDHCFGLAWLQQGSRLRRLDVTLVPRGALHARAQACADRARCMSAACSLSVRR